MPFVEEAHPAYISWGEYEQNWRRLLEDARAQGQEREKSPACESPALLQGLIVYGRCGRHMTVRYHAPGKHLARLCLPAERRREC